MSGPKRAQWYFVHDPIPTRLADLSAFSGKLDAWLGRHSAFIKQNLGEAAVARAVAAIAQVQRCIDVRAPDAGFDAYGNAWRVLKRLQQDAGAAKRRRAGGQRRRAKQAISLVAKCRRAWDCEENRQLLRRWADPGDYLRLGNRLDALRRDAGPGAAQTARRWLADLKRTVRLATARAEENSRAVRACLPGLHTALQKLGELNAGVLDVSDRDQLVASRTQLRQAAQAAVAAEDLSGLRSAIRGLDGVATAYRPRVKAAELKKAAEVWKQVLSGSGYSVDTRVESDGTVVLKAASFPMRSVEVQMSSKTNEVQVNVDGSPNCVQDVKALQAQLARQGMQVQVTDWGKGGPQHAHQRLSAGLSTGGML